MVTITAQDSDPQVVNVLRRYEALEKKRWPMDTMWEEVAKYAIPRRSYHMPNSQRTPSMEVEERLYDSTVAEAVQTNANGQLSWMSPVESPWFAFEPYSDNNNEKKDLAKTTEDARDELALSSFYSAIHEFYLDRAAFGTSCLFVKKGRRRLIHAQHWSIGTYVIDEDDEGEIDTVMRCLKMSYRQAVQRWGLEALSVKIQEKYKEDPSKADELELEVIHAIYPREDAARDKSTMARDNMEWAEVFIDKTHQHKIEEGGYEEKPFMVSRYLKWGSGWGNVYGYSPSFIAVPTARQLNFLQKMMDALGEKAAFPPVLAPEDLEGEIDANANGVTYFSQAMTGGLPQEWQTQGRYDVGRDRIAEKQQAIKDAFHVDLFQMFANLDKEMTAREVVERRDEKVLAFSPTFARMVTEVFNPLLERIWGLMMRDRWTPPMSLIHDLGDGTGLLGLPKIKYSSRLALALRALPALGYTRAMDRVLAIASLHPKILHVYDFAKAEIETALSDGVPPEFLREPDDIEQMDAEYDEQMAAQAQAQAAASGSQAAKNISDIDPEMQEQLMSDQ